MKVSRVIGVGLVALGIVLLYYGYTSTQSYIRVTGTYTAHALRHLVRGADAVLSDGLPAIRQNIDDKLD